MVSNRSTRYTQRDAYRILFRFKWRAMAVFVAIIAIVVFSLIMIPRAYISEARLFVKTGRESVTLDPTATTGQNVMVNDSREGEVRSLEDVLRSRVLLENVVDDLGEKMVLGSTTDGPLSAWLKTAGIADSIDRREKAIHRLQKTIVVANARRSAVVTIRAKASSPETAQRIVTAFSNAYYRLHHRVHRTEGSEQFFESQTALLKQQLADTTSQLRDLKNRVGLVSVESQRDIIEGQIKSLGRELILAEAARSSVISRISALQLAHPDVSRNAKHEAATTVSPKALDDMRDQLYTLQIQQREMSARYNAGHPRLLAMRAQVDGARYLLEELELQIEESRAASLTAQIDNLDQEHRSQIARLQQLNENEVQIRELERNAELLRANYMTYARSRELARISNDLDARQISNVNLIQPATLVTKPVSPQKLPILVLGLLAAVFGAAGVALAGNWLDQSLTSPEDIESQRSLPVLLTIPRIGRNTLLNN
ncbi:MAG: GumC family protein [Pirellulaceae bacterium]|nr:GumC family protein [Pirellulaceae bacterium]